MGELYVVWGENSEAFEECSHKYTYSGWFELSGVTPINPLDYAKKFKKIFKDIKDGGNIMIKTYSEVAINCLRALLKQRKFNKENVYIYYEDVEIILDDNFRITNYKPGFADSNDGYFNILLGLSK